MNYSQEDMNIELEKLKAELDIASVFLIEALEAFNSRLERAEKWIEDQKKLMLN